MHNSNHVVLNLSYFGTFTHNGKGHPIIVQTNACAEELKLWIKIYSKYAVIISREEL